VVNQIEFRRMCRHTKFDYIEDVRRRDQESARF
jgi:hypothetical protein